MFDFFLSTEKKLEKARLSLIERLNRSSMDYLIMQMKSDEIYSPLLHKKRKMETSNTDTVSWYAYRRAEQLNLLEEKEQLIKKLKALTDDTEKQHIYFCLANYCKNTADSELFNFLMDRLEIEQDNSSKLSILLGIAYMPKPSGYNIEPLKKLAKTRNRDLRVNSIIALQQTNDKEVEDLLLPIFLDTKDNHIKNVITWTLETTGTAKSIPVLEAAYKRTRDYGLRAYIERTIENIRKNSTP